LKEEVKKLFDIRDYRILFFAISFGLGTFNTLIALLNQLVENYDYSNDDAGNFGALLIVFGIFFSGVTGYILDVTHKYKEALKIFFVAGCFSLLFWLSSIYHNNLTTLCIASTILGSFVVPLIPIVTECTAEVTYPISEDISVGILLVGGNYISIFMTLLVQWLIDQVPLGPPPFLPSSILLFVALLVSTISVLFFEGDYRRLKVDQVSSSPSS
jgi:MFS family permease